MNARLLVTELFEASIRRALGGAASQPAVGVSGVNPGDDHVPLSLVSKIMAVIRPAHDPACETQSTKADRGVAKWLPLVAAGFTIISGLGTIIQMVAPLDQASHGTLPGPVHVPPSQETIGWFLPAIMVATFASGLISWIWLRLRNQMHAYLLPSLACSVVAIVSALCALWFTTGGADAVWPLVIFVVAIGGQALLVSGLVRASVWLRRLCRSVLALSVLWVGHQFFFGDVYPLPPLTGLALPILFWGLALLGRNGDDAVCEDT